MNKAQKIIWGVFGLFMALIPAYLNAHLAGPDPRHTGAPGDDPLACATAQCHTGSPKGGPINAAGGSVMASLCGGATYTPGVPQTISVTVSDPVNTYFGFQMTARLESDLANGQAGDFTPGPHQIVLCDDGSLKGKSGCPTSTPVQFVEHSFTVPPPNSIQTPYTFTWTPPATNVGNVHFYVAGNVVDNALLDVADAGDHVYTNTFVLTPAAPGPVPTILTGGVLNSASYAKDSSGLGSPVAPGSLVQIYGTNLGNSPSHACTVPLSTGPLGGVTVTFNNVPAPMLDVSPLGAFPTAIAEIPSAALAAGQSSGTGNVVVTVNGVSSAAQTFPLVATAPGIYSSPVGAGNAILVFQDPADMVVKVAAPASLPSGSFTIPTAAIPRGTAGVLYATGLGALNPAVADGAATPVSPSAVTPVVLVGGAIAQVQFAGQAGLYPGVNQLNIVIPAGAPTGDAVPIQIQSGSGTPTTSLVTIAVR